MGLRAVLLCLTVAAGGCSVAYAQGAPPDRTDLHAAYCLGNDQAFANNLAGVRFGDPIAQRTQQEALEHNATEIRRIQRYLLSRGVLNSPDPNTANELLAAAAQAKDDLASAVNDLSNPADPYGQCMTQCQARHVTFASCMPQCESLEGEPQRHLASCKNLDAELPY